MLRVMQSQLISYRLSCMSFWTVPVLVIDFTVEVERWWVSLDDSDAEDSDAPGEDWRLHVLLLTTAHVPWHPWEWQLHFLHIRETPLSAWPILRSRERAVIPIGSQSGVVPRGGHCVAPMLVTAASHIASLVGLESFALRSLKLKRLVGLLCALEAEEARNLGVCGSSLTCRRTLVTNVGLLCVCKIVGSLCKDAKIADLVSALKLDVPLLQIRKGSVSGPWFLRKVCIWRLTVAEASLHWNHKFLILCVQGSKIPNPGRQVLATRFWIGMGVVNMAFPSANLFGATANASYCVAASLRA